MLRNSHRSVKAGIWIIFGQTRLRHSSHHARGEPSKADLGIKAGFSRESLIPEPFTLRKSTARKAMVKVIITLAYSSAGSFCRVGREPWGEGRRSQPQTLVPCARGTHGEGAQGSGTTRDEGFSPAAGSLGYCFPPAASTSRKEWKLGNSYLNFYLNENF